MRNARRKNFSSRWREEGKTRARARHFRRCRRAPLPVCSRFFRRGERRAIAVRKIDFQLLGYVVSASDCRARLLTSAVSRLQVANMGLPDIETIPGKAREFE